MKKLIFLLLLVLSFQACNKGAANQPDLTTLAGKKEWLKTQKITFNELKKEIEDLEAQIDREDPQANKKPKMLTITTDSVRIEDYQEYVEVQGSVATKGNFIASSEIGGRILNLTVDEGDYVQRGALIAQLDDSQITSGIAEIETGLNLARDVFERRSRLWAQGIGSELEYLQAKNQVESLEDKLATVRVSLQKTNVYAPASGVVEMVNSKQGELASPGRPIVTLVDLSRVQIVANIAENYLKAVKKGQKVEVSVPSLELETSATISKIGAMLNPMNRTFSIEADIANKGNLLKPNIMTLLKIKDYEKKDAVVIPTNLIKQDAQGDYVFIVQQDGENTIAKEIRIQIGRSANGKTVVESGLVGNEMLIAEGRAAVKNGDLVTTNQ